jgi:hypothetical protein
MLTAALIFNLMKSKVLLMAMAAGLSGSILQAQGTRTLFYTA